MHVTTGEPAAQGPRRDHSPRRNLRRTVATLTLVSAVAAAAWWDTHPAVFSDYGNGVGIRNDVDDPALFALTLPEARGGTRSIHVLGITSRRAGRVVVDGATLTYRVGVRFGRQHVGMSSIATFTRHGSQQSRG